MEEAWLAAKCGSRWPPSLPASSPAWPLPPPPAPLAPPASSLGAANPMGLDSHKFRHPFIQQINIGDSAIVQEPKIFNTLNLDSCKSGKAELGSSFLSLLSGSAHPASSKFLQLPYSGPELAKFHAREGGVVNGPRCDVPVTSISPISESRGVIENDEDFPFVSSRPLSMSTCTNFPLLQNNFQAATSSCHSTRFGKTVPRQAFPGNNAGTKVLSRKHEWPIASSPSNANQQCISNQTTEKMPLEARPSNRSHSSTTFRGRPHVFCMNKVGELFVSDMGLLGVLCFCHKQPMSVAKFCEHSGFPSANPGEAVHLENGMTVAQWRKLCFGVMASDRSNEWEWSDGSSAEVGLVRSKFSSFPASSKNSASLNSFEAFSELGKIGEPRNKTIYPNHTYGGLRGQTASEKSAKKGTENVLQRKGLDRQNLSTKRFAGSAQSTIPALSKNHMAQAIKESPIRMGFEGSHLTLNQGEQNVVPQLVANNISYKGEIGNHPISFPHSGMNNTFSCANHIHKGNFSGQTFVVDQDGSSSNIELRLGHPSQKNNTPGSFPVAMHPFHLGSVCNLQKAQLHQPLAHTNAADYPKESKKPRLDLQCTLSEESPLNRRLHHSSGNNVFKHSEIEDPMGDATKSSLISFLSHLNTEGNSSSHSTDIIGNYSEYFGARVLDSASLYAKCNFSDFARDLIDGIEKKPDTNGSDLSNNIDQAKGLNIVDNGSHAVVKPNYVIHRKQPPDARVLSSATGGHCIYNSSSVDNRQPTLYFNQPSGMLQTAPNYRNSDKYAEVSLQGNRDRCSCTIHTSTSSIPNATARHCSHNSENLISFSSTNSMHISEPVSALSNKKSADRTQNLRDESFISLPLRHMDELSKLELPTSSLETNTRCKRLCCLSDVGFLRNVCKDDLVATKELRETPYCIIQQDESSNVVKSAHSFSNCCSSCDVQMSSANADSNGPFKCCNCSASTQRLSCSKEHGIQFSTSHTCHAFEKPCLRLGRISNNSYPDSNKHEVCNHKEESSSVSGKCCCTALPKYLTGCCFSGGDSLSGALSEHLCGKIKTMHVSPTYDRDNMLQDGRRVRLGQCECLRKHVVMKNDCQIALWRDVPNKVRGHSDAAANEKPAQVVQATRLVGDQLTDTPAKEIDGTHQESRSLNEQQMSNVSSGSSAAAVTEISIEVNNTVSITTDAGNFKIVCDSMVNEGSRIEKCGSSDEALDNRESEEAINFTDRVKPINSSGNLTNELRLNGSSNFRRPRNQISVGCTDQENISQIHQFEPACRVGKRKGPMKQSRIDASVPKLGFASLYSDYPEHVSHSLHQPSPQELDTPHQSDNIMRKMRVYSGRSPSFKRKRSALSSTKPFYLKGFKKHHKVSECDKVQSIYNDHSHRKQKVSAGKKAKQNWARDGKKQFTKEKDKLADAGRLPKFMSLSCIGSSLNHRMDTSYKKVRPVVCSNSGIISTGAGDKQKPAKIVSLSLILKKASRCSITEHGGKPRLSCISGNKKTCLDAKIGCHNAISTWKLQCENEASSVIRNGMDPSNLVSSKIKKISSKNEKCPYEFSIMKRDSDYGYDEALKSTLHHEIAISGSKPRCKETREDEYIDLTESRNQLKTSPPTDIGDALVGNEHSTMKSCSKKILNTATSANAKLLVISQNGQDHADEPREINTRRCQSFISDLDAFCCVCGSSNKEDINQLLECHRCLIRVHQACYGISKVPKGRWCCRPCKTNSLNIVCVLCGYGGGAMTRALKSRNIVKSLLKAWNVGRGLNLINPASSSNGIKNEVSEPGSVGEASEYDGSVHVVESISSEAFPADASEADLTKTVTMSQSDSMPNNFQASNSVTVGILDPSVTQWVHMVCGLWTPGTRCPNVDTMSAFDVSGASPARKITVCSMCNRPGGSCIQCRVMNCSVHFHPWCAHQKGLLQSEIEGDDNENVGFYGRCLLHATPSSSQIHSYLVDTEVDSSKNKDWTCARTEGFKGRKRDEGFNPNHHKPYNDGGGCIVSQEQINAWLHINGQKSCTRRAVKLPLSDIEYDVRKEYIRYKQSKAWKQLVVYKSGIHALGLYTSQFISRGAMVVEYVGEIVGLRIADKREVEYQSGRRLQYKSACYFFRIDKEHIIDATRKGGIARFVNHSCLPNCVAKVISVRNEKKVVFFAERDIYPGEEITYDYHFNHEDEGKKIPCFCNSKNCRRYLN